MVPDLQAQLVIPPVSTGIGDARRFTREHLTTWGQDGLTETAMLMISELVTNAILHGGHGAVLTLQLTQGKLRAEVRDSNPATPVVRGYSDTATTGRGMVIVDALAAAWGSFPVDGGKVVWFELETAARESGSHDGGARRTSSRPSLSASRVTAGPPVPPSNGNGPGWSSGVARMPAYAAP